MTPVAYIVLGVAVLWPSGVACDRLRRTRWGITAVATVIVAADAVDAAVRRWDWAARAAWAVGLISEDDLAVNDLGDER